MHGLLEMQPNLGYGITEVCTFGTPLNEVVETIARVGRHAKGD